MRGLYTCLSADYTTSCATSTCCDQDPGVNISTQIKNGVCNFVTLFGDELEKKKKVTSNWRLATEQVGGTLRARSYVTSQVLKVFLRAILTPKWYRLNVFSGTERQPISESPVLFLAKTDSYHIPFELISVYSGFVGWD
jgi:hypothetical protein